jgi:hypothetical protein
VGEHGGGGLGGGRNRIPCRLCASRLSVSAVVLARPRSSRAAASPIRSGSRLGGRPARSRHNDKRFAAGPSGSPTAKRRSRSAPSSVLTRSILAGAVALVRARRWRSALAAGGSRRQESVKQREAGAGGEERIALPCRSPAPRPGPARPGTENLAGPRGWRRPAVSACALAASPAWSHPGRRRGRQGGRGRRESRCRFRFQCGTGHYPIDLSGFNWDRNPGSVPIKTEDMVRSG